MLAFWFSALENPSRSAESLRRGPARRGATLTFLVLLCYKTLVDPRRASTPATGETLQQRAGEEFVHRGDRGGDVPFRPHRERPAA